MQVFAARFARTLPLFVGFCRLLSICECLKPSAIALEFRLSVSSICVAICCFLTICDFQLFPIVRKNECLGVTASNN